MRFKLPPVSALPSELRFVLERIELFLNKAIPDIENDARWTNQRFPVGPENVKIVRGNVIGATGTNDGGTGFSITRHAVGQYTMTFTPVFSAKPAVTYLGTQIGYRNSLSASAVRIHFFTDAGVAVDADFSFTATGPA